jgi:hypothetical protein
MKDEKNMFQKCRDWDTFALFTIEKYQVVNVMHELVLMLTKSSSMFTEKNIKIL